MASIYIHNQVKGMFGGEEVKRVFWWGWGWGTQDCNLLLVLAHNSSSNAAGPEGETLQYHAHYEWRSVTCGHVCVCCRVGPNRHTFTCPACGAKNLTCEGLLKHVNDTHKGEKLQVVCGTGSGCYDNPLDEVIAHITVLGDY